MACFGARKDAAMSPKCRNSQLEGQIKVQDRTCNISLNSIFHERYISGISALSVPTNHWSRSDPFARMASIFYSIVAHFLTPKATSFEEPTKHGDIIASTADAAAALERLSLLPSRDRSLVVL